MNHKIALDKFTESPLLLKSHGLFLLLTETSQWFIFTDYSQARASSNFFNNPVILEIPKNETVESIESLKFELERILRRRLNWN